MAVKVKNWKQSGLMETGPGWARSGSARKIRGKPRLASRDAAEIPERRDRLAAERVRIRRARASVNGSPSFWRIPGPFQTSAAPR